MDKDKSKELELVDLLTIRTATGQTKWEPTAKPDEFLTVVADEISVLIAQVPAREYPDQGPDFLLTVKDKNDQEIISIRNALGDLKYNDLLALHEVARRNALNIDKTLDILLKNLKEF